MEASTPTEEGEPKWSLVGMNEEVNILVQEVSLPRRNTASFLHVDDGVPVDPVSLTGGFVNEHPPSLPLNLTAMLPSIRARNMGASAVDLLPFRFRSALLVLY